MGSEGDQKMDNLTHVLMVSFPGQGHINPLLRLGKRLASKGLLVTFSTTADYGEVIRDSNDAVSDDQPIPVGNGFIRFEFIDDELPDKDPRRQDMDQYLPLFESVGRVKLVQMVDRLTKLGLPVSCLINNPFIPWVSDVADELGIPSAMLWVQSCACFLAYYSYYNKLVSFPDENTPHIDVEIPSLPLLKWDEIPTFLHPSTPYGFLKRAILGQYKNLSKPFCILADTFYELEKDIFDYTNTLCPIRPVGPLFKDQNPEQGSGFSKVRADPMRADKDCMTWLETKPRGTVVYISFGTVVYLKQEQVDEIAHGLEVAGIPFLWVMKPPHPDTGKPPHSLPAGFLERAGDNGKVVHFAPQEQVLAHPSVACFMTHCGWNSTMEALTSGIPVIAFPQWGDQVTDAKFLCDVFGVGVQLCRGEQENRIIPREEVEKCLRDATTGSKAVEMKRNALKWKASAEMAIAEGGSSDQNIQAFIDEIRKKSELVLGNLKNCNGKTLVEANGP